MSALSVSIPEMSESLTLDIDASRGEAIVLVMVFLWTVAAGPKPVTNGAIRHVAARRIRIAILLYYVVLCSVVGVLQQSVSDLQLQLQLFVFVAYRMRLMGDGRFGRAKTRTILYDGWDFRSTSKFTFSGCYCTRKLTSFTAHLL